MRQRNRTEVLLRTAETGRGIRSRRENRLRQLLSHEPLEDRRVLAVTLDMVRVENAGNAADTNGYGDVAYDYQIGKYEVTIGQYAEFLNAAAKSDPYSLYSTSMATDLNVAGISRVGSSGSYTYSVIGSSGNKPITYVSWFDAARFANWMHNGQGSGSTETGAYTLGGLVDGNTVAKNPIATFYIPTENEWYKAAYYDPIANFRSGYYYKYATKGDDVPRNNIGPALNQANVISDLNFCVTQAGSLSSSINYLTDVGAFTNSVSYYGTFDQNGNVEEYCDPKVQGFVPIRGGSWFSGSGNGDFDSSFKHEFAPAFGSRVQGFRLASPASTVPTAPGQPTGVFGTPGNGLVNLSWLAPASSGGLPITDYLVEYKTQAELIWRTVMPRDYKGAAQTVTGLTNGIPYVFRVSAMNAAGTGIPSVVSRPVTPAAGPTTTAPSQPTGLVGTPGNGRVSLSWAAPASTGGSAITDYLVEYKTQAASTWTTFSRSASTATTATVTGLTNGTAYVFRVSGKNAIGAGVPSDASSSVTPQSLSYRPEVGVFVNSGAFAMGDSTTFFTSSGANNNNSVAVTLVNYGNGDLLISNWNLNQGFVTTSSFPERISPNSSVTLNILSSTSFLGRRGGNLTFNTNDSDEPRFTISLSGMVFESVYPVAGDAIRTAPSGAVTLYESDPRFTVSIEPANGGMEYNGAYVIRRFDPQGRLVTRLTYDGSMTDVVIYGSVKLENWTYLTTRPIRVQLRQ